MRPALAQLLWLSAFLLLPATSPAEENFVGTVPEDFPRFLVPGHEREMTRLRELYWLHYAPAGPLIPLWDAWMPMGTLWPARGDGEQLQAMRRRWAQALAERSLSAEGYVHTQQHDGPGHAEGWPFPRWNQAGGIGWHFVPIGLPGYEPPLVTPEGWTLTGAQGGNVNDRGWPLELTEPAAMAQTPAFALEARNAPWLRLNWWATGLGQANCYLEWTTTDCPEFAAERRIYFAPATDAGAQLATLPLGAAGGKTVTSTVETRTMLPVHRLPNWKGTITGLRIAWDNAGPAKVLLKSVHTACDTRQTVNNPNFIRGCRDYFVWSRDLTFLRTQMPRIRSAMRFVFREFDTQKRKCLYTTWPGHEGRSGVRWVDGRKVIVPGEGIGSNYWDILPFGGEDAEGTVYYYDSLLALAELEEEIAAHPEWTVATGADAFDPAELRRHAQEVRDYCQKRFWNPQTSRFGTIDLDGVMHDYGYTLLNDEAICFGLATAEQAQLIQQWMSGTRTVAEDTAQGEDIYFWRFAPRASTRRNVDYYFWGWSKPEKIPFGAQVQDGGAVLGFSYFDLLARLKTAGPADAWQRLQAILAWFSEVQEAGGYRAYYRDPAHGTLQGENTAGGLGLDKEFFESILPPQIMLYGFLGLRPTATGCTIDPQLPPDWSELTITRIHLHDHVLDIRVTADAIEVTDHSPTRDPLAITTTSARQVRVTPPGNS